MRKLERATGDEQAIHDRRWWILATLCVCLLVVVIDNTILNVALPDIQRELGATQTAEQWFLDAYTLTFAALLFSAGVLGDRYGRVRALVVGLSIFGLGSLLCAFAPSPNWLIGFRALQAGGGALVLPSTLSIINYTFEGEERGRAVGVWAGVSGLAIAIGPITGGLLLEFFWWGSVFLVNVPIVVIGIALIVLVIPESRDPDPGELDPRGVLLSILGLVAVVFGIVRIGQQNGIDTWSIASIVVGAIVLAIFVLAERRSDHPSLDVSLFKDARFSAAALAVTSAFFALFGSTFFLTFYLQFDRMYSPLQAGIRLLPVAVAVVSFSPLSSRLVARFGIRIVCTAGLLTVAGAFAIYQIIDTGTNIWVLEGLLFIQGTGLANVIPPATDSILSVLPREKSGAGSAVNNVTRQVGGALGIAVLGSILSITYGHAFSARAGQLPAPLRSAAQQSIGAASQIAKSQGGQLGNAILRAAHPAFIHALHVTALGSCAMGLLGAVIAGVWLPGKHRRDRDDAARHADARDGDVSERATSSW